MLTKKIGMTAAALAAAGAIVAGGAAISNASTETTASTTASTAGQSLGYGMGYDSGAQGQRGPGGQGRHAHTAVTGDELAKVTAAVKAKDSGVTVTSVEKDLDGSYDVHGTKAGAEVMVEVSKDLKTIEVRTGGPGQGGRGHGGPGGQGRHAHTAVTGDELAKVTAAVKAKDSGVTVTSVQKDPDGSYDVHSTKSGANVMVEVSKDLKTIEVRTGGPGQGGKGDSSAPGSSTQGSTQASPSSSAA